MGVLIALTCSFFLISAVTGTPVPDEKITISGTIKPTTNRIKEHGYPAEEHIVQTADGYLLKMFRIPYSHNLQNQNSVRPMVLIQHGLFSCSDIWIACGPDDALPFLLADLGYDVWLGNARGNIYSRNNTKLLPGNPRFWRFSWHEIGVYDISAMIDYMLAKTNQKAVHYVGHSQGTSVFFVLMSMRPEYNEKIKTAHMLAPIGYMNHMSNLLVNVFAPHLGKRGIYNSLFESAEFLPRNEAFVLLGFDGCSEDAKFSWLCSVMGMISSGNDGNTNTTSMSIISETHPAGASSDQILHYFQEFNSGHFRQYDFGAKKNMAVYNQAYPPDYDIENISSEVHIYYSDNDSMAAVEDVLRLAERLPNLKSSYHVPDPTFTHLDFGVAWQVKEVINDKIIDKMEEYENKSD